METLENDFIEYKLKTLKKYIEKNMYNNSLIIEDVKRDQFNNHFNFEVKPMDNRKNTTLKIYFNSVYNKYDLYIFYNSNLCLDALMDRETIEDFIIKSFYH